MSDRNLYCFRVKEELSRYVYVYAKNLNDAYNVVDDKWRNAEVVLGADDFDSVDIEYIPGMDPYSLGYTVNPLNTEGNKEEGNNHVK